MIRMEIHIQVEVPAEDNDKRLEFIEGVMAVFRATFPEVNPIIRPGAPPPVTVTFTEEEDHIPDPNAKKIHIPTHEEIIKGMEDSEDNDG